MRIEWDRAAAARVAMLLLEADARADAPGRLGGEAIRRIVDAVSLHPWGAIEARGGKGGRRVVTVLEVYAFWYTRGRAKTVEINWTLPVSSEPGRLNINTSANVRRTAWRAVFPDRARRLNVALVRRKLRPLGVEFPECAEVVMHMDPTARLALVMGNDKGKYLCSPIGYLKVDPFARGTVWGALESLGAMPQITWEQVEPYLALLLLAR